MENFRNVRVWRRALNLAVRIARATRSLPEYEQQELGTQMRKSARSIHANIAEACGRKVALRGNADSLRVLVHASGELHELDSDVEYCLEAGYWPAELAIPLLDEIDEVRRMLASFIVYRRDNDRYSPRRKRRRRDDAPIQPQEFDAGIEEELDDDVDPST